MIEQRWWFLLALPGLAGAGAFLLGFLGHAVTGGLAATVCALAAIGLVIALDRLSRRPRARRSQRPPQPEPFARRDALTGLAGPAALLDRLHILLAGERRSDRMIGLLLIDLVDFAAIDRDHGHAAGDLVLRHTGTRLLGSLREGDLLARLRADQFVVLLSEVERPLQVAALAGRLLRVMAEPFELCGEAVAIEARIGLALAPGDRATRPDDLLEQAQLALARAKADRLGEPRFAEAGLDADLRERQRLERDLAVALERGQLAVHYQPQIDLGSRRIVGVEALLRWQHPRLGDIPPDRFIPIAEDTGLILPIGRWVLEQACAQAAAWRARGAELRLAVNLSPCQLQDPEIADHVAEALDRSGLAAESLGLEITERLLLARNDATIAMLGRLKALGVQLSIDDFGVGHAALDYLRHFPVDEIKVDRSFVAGLAGDDPTALAIVRSTLQLGAMLGLRVVAEGIETEAQLATIAGDGCPIAQGFYFSRAVHPAEVEAMVFVDDLDDNQLPEVGNSPSDDQTLTG